MAQAHVLIVDDNRALARTLARFVEMHGYKATTASNGQEAVERFREHDYSMAFMDVHMPVMNGADSFLEIRQLRPSAKVVLMTALVEPLVEKAMRGGALGLLQKPFQLSRLLPYLAAAVASSPRTAAP